MSSFLITWNGHSCFTVSYGGYSAVLDPYAPDSVPGLSPLSLNADAVLCSHDHRDHGFREAVQLPETAPDCPFAISVIDTWHDDDGGSKRGANRIHILEAGGIRIAHLGDLGCELSDEQLEQLKGLDALMIPVGGYYTIDAAQAKALVTKLCPNVTIPMHYRSDTFGYPVVGRLEEYTALCGDVVSYSSNQIRIEPGMKKQTAVLALA